MFKTINDGKLPTKGTKYSAAVDVYANEDITIHPGQTKLIPLGIRIDEEELHKVVFREHKAPEDDNIDRKNLYIDWFKESMYLQLMLRSSLGKKGLVLPNGVGIIDMDYRDEIKLIIHNPLTMENTECEDDFYNSYELVTSNPYSIYKGDRIGQMILLEHKTSLLQIKSQDERTGGFGSTNKDKK